MNEILKEIKDDLKDRSTNPFITSFIITWLIGNWPILIGLFFYSSTELTKLKPSYKSYFDLIQTESTVEKMLVYPFLGGIIYTFIFSIGKQGIIAYTNFIVSRRRDIQFRVTKDHQSITVGYHNKVKTQLEEDAVKFATLANQEEVIKLENDSLKKVAAEHESLLIKKDTENLEEVNLLKKNHNLSIEKIKTDHQAQINAKDLAIEMVETNSKSKIRSLQEDIMNHLETIKTTGEALNDLRLEKMRLEEESFKKIQPLTDLMTGVQYYYSHTQNSSDKEKTEFMRNIHAVYESYEKKVGMRT